MKQSNSGQHSPHKDQAHSSRFRGKHDEAQAPPGSSGTIDKGLKAGAIGLASTVVIGVASTAPGYSLAASLGFVTDSAGAQAPAILWLAFVPMLFIAAAHFYLNRADPDCGTTFTWATRALGPIPGWMGGWADGRMGGWGAGRSSSRTSS